MLDDNDIYRNLQLHLDQFPVGFPPTKTGIEIKVLKHLFSEKEALIATELNWSYATLEDIYERLDSTQISIELLEDLLNNMIKKGTIKYKIENGKKLYANLPLVVGIFEYQVNKLTKEFFEDFDEYLVSAFGAELLGTKISQFRTIPIQQSIAPENFIANYDEVKQIIQNSEEPLTVANCVCRQSKELYDQPCEKTSLRETCFYFGKTGQLFLDQGWARQVSRDEILEIMEKAESDGLIFQSGNTVNPEFICSCCGCCCAILTKLQKLPRPSRVISSNFHAEINPDLCVNCGTCVEHCLINSIKLKENVANIILKRCIGCGVCVPTCPEGAIQLKKKGEEMKPPSSQEELFSQIMEKKQQLRKK
ncbi:MAG: 4Fe-4S binding protein [Candidatus Lokiarchaeota archaeon]|nr:4Fe-4S binding protein [Candidatus Lokiarchaeota archaeon]